MRQTGSPLRTLGRTASIVLARRSDTCHPYHLDCIFGAILGSVGIFQVPLSSGLGSSSIFLQIKVPRGSCHPRDGADPLRNAQVQRGN